MDKVVYLTGAGAICAEMEHQGIESNLSMRGIGSTVSRMSESRKGPYSILRKNFSIPQDQDIEVILSLLEGHKGLDLSPFKTVCPELRQLFREYLLTEINGKSLVPKIHNSLLHIHNKYGPNMGENGESLLGILTLNYDSILDAAFHDIYGIIDYGYITTPPQEKPHSKVPLLLKMHGSFNWCIEKDELAVSGKFEQLDYKDKCTGWMPPSVYKKPHEKVFPELWEKASNLLTECDVLRVLGCSLRSEDFALISLIFSAQVMSKPFRIELIVPDTEVLGREGDAVNPSPKVGMMQRLPFLGNMQNLSSLTEYKEDSYRSQNPLKSWVLMKLAQIEKNIGHSLDDELINSNLMLGG